MSNGVVIQKNPVLPLAEDYYALRAEGLAAIEALGSAQWTDYNAHDPGITLLEALCYALSEAGYRVGFDIADILTEPNGFIGLQQALFTARRILLNNPLTVTDFRKVLVDLEGVRNGWLLCKSCPCPLTLYAECKESALYFAPLWRLRPPLPRSRKAAAPHEHPSFPKGLYDVLLEFDEHPELGDLNDRKILHVVSYPLPDASALAPLTIELRFPDWEAEQPDLFALFSAPTARITTVGVPRFSRDRVLNEPVTPDSFVQGWRGVFYADFSITFVEDPDAALPVSHVLTLAPTAIRFFSPKEGVKRVVNGDLANLQNAVLGDDDPLGSIAAKYQRKLQALREARMAAKARLHALRNLCEDFCRIEGVRVEDVAVCADVETAVGADIEWVLAKIYDEISLYFNPPVRFYALQALENEGLGADAIFDGPALENGFIKTEDMEASALRSVIRVSDLLNRLMDIPGVLAIKDLQLTRYDAEGNPVLPSEKWTLTIGPGSIPKLYVNASRFLFYKNGLPLLPRTDEVQAIWTQLRGERALPKLPASAKDYPVPTGQYRDLAAYFPVQHSLPRSYGVGSAGLPDSAPALRQAQAHQLKAYLMVFEQLTANLNSQLAHVRDLFSTDETLRQTYFPLYFDPAASPPPIAGLPALLTGAASATALQGLTEPEQVFLERRNRFLDHLLARFGESFQEYALLLHANEDRVAFAPDKLIVDKSRFLRDYPRVSARRAKAFDYRDAARACDPRNRAGLAERIQRLLGMEMFRSYFSVTVSAGQQHFSAEFLLKDPQTGAVLLKNADPISAGSGQEAEDAAWALVEDLIANSPDPARYANAFGFVLVQDEAGNNLAVLEPGVLAADLQDLAAELLERERLYIVEHLLLRPKFWGDALYPVCLEQDCALCGEEDPYSFQMTYVLQGRLEPFSLDIDLRRFAEQTIRKETPSHLLPKLCWVGDEGYEPDPCNPLVGRIAAILQQYDASLNDAAACACALAVHDGLSATFRAWMADKVLAMYPERQWADLVEALFLPVQSGDFACTNTLPAAAWAAVKAEATQYFAQLAATGMQFSRFEAAWCAWLVENAPFDWQQETALLHKQVEKWLLGALGISQPTAAQLGSACRCAELLLGYFGNRFQAWVAGLVALGTEPDAAAAAQMEPEVWDGFLQDLALIRQNDPRFCLPARLAVSPARWDALKNLLLSRYAEWLTVSYRLAALIQRFTRLASIYPAATLHDCDDGNDDNPVRLNNTILGSM
jgi:hypothetical protein